ncbi:MAG TPA: hypothetical protein PKH31_13990 [Candidatus Sumerlaeota bacterium]|nr:hypothetical protein [Candidatus Sumerlaeota bacterium]
MHKGFHRKSGKALHWIVGTIALIGVVLYWGIPQYSEYKVFSKFTPEMRSKFDYWTHLRFTISSEDLRVQPFSPVTLNSLHQFKTLLSTHETALQTIAQELSSNSAPMTVDMIEPYRLRIGAMTPLCAAFARTIQQPDYTMEAWFAAEGPATDECPVSLEPLRLMPVLGMVYLDAMLKLKDNRIEEALWNAETLVKFVHNELFSSVSLRTSPYPETALSYAGTIYRNAFLFLQDPTRKNAILDQLQRLKVNFNIAPPSGMDLICLDLIGMTAQARRAGFEPNFMEKSGFEVFIESLRIQSSYQEKCVLPFLPDGPKKTELQKITTGYKELMRQLRLNRSGLRKYNTKKFDRILAAAAYASCRLNEDEVAQKIEKVDRLYETLLTDLKNVPVANEQGTPPASGTMGIRSI